MACARSFTAFPGLFILFLGALAVVRAHRLDGRHWVSARATQNPWVGTSAYQQIGTSGVSAMQMSVVDDRYVIFFDKAEHNPLQTSKGKPAWGALLDTNTHKVRALKLVTNSFCAGESYLCLARCSFLLTYLRLRRRGMAWQWYVGQLWWLP
jgi:hypothetical protein